MGDAHGKFLWYELNTTDIEAAKAFYSEVVGWKVQVWTDAGQPYPMLMAGDKGVGGLAELPEQARAMGAPPHWIAYIGADNADATVAAAEKTGGKTYFGPFDIPKVGRIAVFGDPQGATFAILQPAPMEGEQPAKATGPGSFIWNELMTSDPDAGWTFYSGLFGWAKHESMDMGPGGLYQMFGAPEDTKASYGGIMKKPAEAPVSAWVHYVSVAELDKSIELTKKLGGQIVHGPMEIPGGERVAVAMDPQGAIFALHGK